MIRLLSASLYRLKKSAAFWSCLIGMLVIASVFMVMQATSMEYTVPLSRVIFLPLSFYGVAAAAMVSVFTGRDFADGFIRNKLIFSKSRSQVGRPGSFLKITWSRTCLPGILPWASA